MPRKGSCLFDRHFTYLVPEHPADLYADRPWFRSGQEIPFSDHNPDKDQLLLIRAVVYVCQPLSDRYPLRCRQGFSDHNPDPDYELRS